MTDRSFSNHLMASSILVTMATIINCVAMIIGFKIILPTIALAVVIVGLTYFFVIVYRARMAGLI